MSPPALALIVDDRAAFELSAAFAWYEDQQPGLGVEFLRCIDVACANARRFPLMYPVSSGSVRRAPTSRFPYFVFYAVEPEGVVLLAVVHALRDPTMWPSRGTP